MRFWFKTPLRRKLRAWNLVVHIRIHKWIFSPKIIEIENLWNWHSPQHFLLHKTLVLLHRGSFKYSIKTLSSQQYFASCRPHFLLWFPTQLPCFSALCICMYPLRSSIDSTVNLYSCNIRNLPTPTPHKFWKLPTLIEKYIFPRNITL